MLRMRFIISLMVALSVVLLPILGSAAYAASISSPSKSVEVAMSSHDCCEDGIPAGALMHDCQAAAGCASKCFNFYAPLPPAIAHRPPKLDVQPSLVIESLHSLHSSGPFRPPRA